MLNLDLRDWFATPVLLWACAVVPLLSLLAWLAQRARRRALVQLGSLLSLRRLMLVRPHRQRWRQRLACLGVFCLGLAAAGPQWGLDAHAWRGPAADLAVVLDLSRSMNAEQPSRRERALRALRHLADGLEHEGTCRISLVVGAGRPRLLFPLTRDYTHFRHALAQVEQDDLLPLSPGGDEPFVSGTRLGAALALAVQQVEREPDRPRAVLLLSDGHDPAGDREWLDGTQVARAAQVRVHVVGLGDPAAAHTIPVKAGVLQHEGAVVKTRLDEEVLQEIARRTEGTYLPARHDDIPLGTLLPALLAQPPPAAAAGRPMPAQRSAWLLAAALALLLLSMLLSDGPPRRRVSVRLPLALILLGLLTAAAAGPAVAPLVREGNAAFSRGAYEDALAYYAQAEEQTDDPGLVAFNRAAACYRLGRFYEAALCYQRCLEDDQAPGMRRARAQLDLGNALVQHDAEDVETLAQALAAYRACLANQAADADLRGDARHNLEVTQLLWLKARARAANPSLTEKKGVAPVSQPGDKGLQADGNDAADPNGVRRKGDGPGTRPGGSKQVAGGALQSLPDSDALMPLSQLDAEAHLQRLVERIMRQRRHLQQQGHPHTGAAKDW